MAFPGFATAHSLPMNCVSSLNKPSFTSNDNYHKNIQQKTQDKIKNSWVGGNPQNDRHNEIKK